jgi:hypothetical protein
MSVTISTVLSKKLVKAAHSLNPDRKVRGDRTIPFSRHYAVKYPYLIILLTTMRFQSLTQPRWQTALLHRRVVSALTRRLGAHL